VTPIGRASGLLSQQTNGKNPPGARLARVPPWTSAFFTHSSIVCAEQPILAAIDCTAAQREECSHSCSSTIRTARFRIYAENLFVVSLVADLLVIAPSYLEVGVSDKPGAVDARAPPRRATGSKGAIEAHSQSAKSFG
jgi:hypothetical protein